MNNETIDSNLCINNDVSWLGEIPKNWKISKVKYDFRISNLKSKDEDPVVLSLARDGVKVRDITTNEGQLAASYLNYNIVQPNDILLNPMDLISGANCSLSKVSGVISPAYINLKAKNGNDPRYFDYYFKVQYWLMAFFSRGKGVSYDNRWTMNSQTLLNYPLLVPPLEEQKRIADFIDNKCHQIDEIIDGLKQKSNSLQEYKKAITRELVTKGIDNKNFIESDIAWLGDIPNHWTLMRGKYCMACNKIIVGNKVDEYDRLALTLNGVVKRSKDANDGLQPSDFATYQIVKPNQLVFKLIDLQNISTSRVGRSDYLGIVSPAYIVLECGEKLNPRYAEKYYLSMWQREIFNTLGDDGVRSNLNAKDLLDLPILVPPLEEQKQIADYLDDQYKKINEICDGIKEEIRILEDYKKSLIYEYVTGKKVVKDE